MYFCQNMLKCSAASSTTQHSEPTHKSRNYGLKNVFSTDFCMFDLHNSCSGKGAKTMQTVHADKQHYQWVQFILSESPNCVLSWAVFSVRWNWDVAVPQIVELTGHLVLESLGCEMSSFEASFVSRVTRLAASDQEAFLNVMPWLFTDNLCAIIWGRHTNWWECTAKLVHYTWVIIAKEVYSVKSVCFFKLKI